MNLCNNDHPEICYEDKYCPLCQVRDEKYREGQEYQKEISRLDEKLSDALNEIYDLQEEIKKHLEA